MSASAFPARFAGALALIVAAGLPLCPFASVTGVPCPGCGLLRAATALLSGRVHEAAQLYPLVFVALPAVLGASVHVATGLPTSRRARQWIGRAAMLMLVTVIGVWLARFAGAFGGPVTIRALFRG